MPFSIQCFSNRCSVNHESPVACGDVVEDVGNFADTRGVQLCIDPDTPPAQCFLVTNLPVCPYSMHEPDSLFHK